MVDSCTIVIVVASPLSTIHLFFVGQDNNKDKNFITLLPTLGIFIKKYLTTVWKIDPLY
jgi:hypothetical protein